MLVTSARKNPMSNMNRVASEFGDVDGLLYQYDKLLFTIGLVHKRLGGTAVKRAIVSYDVLESKPEGGWFVARKTVDLAEICRILEKISRGELQPVKPQTLGGKYGTGRTKKR